MNDKTISALALGKQFGNPEQVDAEGEEILTVSRKEVRSIYDPDCPCHQKGGEDENAF